MTSSYWFQGPQGVTPGYSVPGSLRFRGSQNLKRNVGANVSPTRTVSFWVKRALDEGAGFGAQHVFTFGAESTVEFDDLSGSFSGGSKKAAIGAYDYSTHNFGDGAYRDPSAWYHVVTQWQGAAVKQWVNGRLNLDKNINQQTPSSITIGSYNDDTFGFKGYMTAVYFHDGVARGPEAFGEFTDDDVWVPIETQFDTADYGAYGFHLDFSDPNDLGADRSGNDNHFTPNGFNTVAPANWIAQVYNGLFTTGTPTAGEIATALASNNKDNITVSGPNGTGGFDGTTSYSITAQPGCAVLRFNTPIENVTRITCEQFNGQGNILNGTDLGNTASDADATPIYDGAPITFESLIAFNRSIPGNGGWYRISVTANGNTFYLVNNNGTDYDSVYDSPTQNFALGNPFMPGTDGGTRTMNYADGNLKLAGGGAAGSLPWSHPSIRVPMGVRAYAEFQMLVAGTAMCGVSERRPTDDGDWGSGGTWSWGIDTRTWIKDPSGTTDTTFVPGNWTNNPGKIAGVEVNTKVTPPTVTFALDGSNPNTFTFNSDFDPDNIWIGCNSGANDMVMNFGQQPFLNQPEGTIALETQNLPEAPIKNGRDHFQAITGAGNGPAAIDPNTQIAVNSYTNPSGALAGYPTSNAFDGDITSYFYVPVNTNGLTTPSIVFDTPMTGTTFEIQLLTPVATNLYVNGALISGTNTGWVDISAEAAGSLSTLGFSSSGSASDGFSALKIDGKLVIEAGILAQAQAAFSNGLWWIKDRVNTNNHQLVDSVRGGDLALPSNSTAAEAAYVAPSGTSVAWCWKAGDAVVTNNEGPIESQVSANPKAGFSIITWTGTGAVGSYGHGLDKAPEMVIHKRRNGTSDWHVLHKDIEGSPAHDVMYLNLTDGHNAGNSNLFRINPDADVIFTGDASSHNEAGATYVDYAWHSVPGYSAFGMYTGNSDPSGAFNYCDFKPAWVMIKASSSDTGFGWFINDTTRQPNNPNGYALQANVTAAELNNTSAVVDLLSNGFKIRGGPDQYNKNGVEYIWAAFAENPFSYPASAR